MSQVSSSRCLPGRRTARRRKRAALGLQALGAEQLEPRELLDSGLGNAGVLTAGQYISGLYRDLLGRMPKPAEAAAWVKALHSGRSSEQVALGVISSAEYREHLIAADYHHFLGRKPSADELRHWLRQMNAGMADAKVATGLLASKEYYADHGGNDAGWLTGLYRDVLHRTPDASGLVHWESQLHHGQSRWQVALSIVQSRAAQAQIVAADYQQLLHRKPDAASLTTWVSALQHGMTNSQLLAKIAATEMTNSHASDPGTGHHHTGGHLAGGGAGDSDDGSESTGTGSGSTGSGRGSAGSGTGTAGGGSGSTGSASASTGSGSGSAGSGTGTGGAGSGSTGAGSASTVNVGESLNIPQAHGRIWWTSDRLAQAKQWYASHPFTPQASDPWGNAFKYVLTGDARYAQAAINSLMNFTISPTQLQQVSVDAYRWADWVPVVYDWVYNAMTPQQQQTFMARYNDYVTTIMQKPWGGPGMPGNNYFWGYFRNEVNWAIATWYENPLAPSILNDALVTRWQNSFLPWAANAGRGGVTPEGSQYGRYMLAYNVVPFETLKLMGRDLLQETNFFKEAALNLIYTTTPAPTIVKDSSASYYQVFPFGDDETNGGYPSASSSYYGDFMTMVAQEWSDQPVGQYARQWLNMVQPPVSKWVAAVDAGGPAKDFSSLPLDYYAPGSDQILYTRNQWGADATSIFLKLGQGTGASHFHHDIGTFQIWRDGSYLSKESTGYSQQFNGGSDSQTISTNGILFNGIGEANAYANGPAKVLRLESTPLYSYAAVDLSQVYRAQASPNPTRDDNPYAGNVVREFIFIKPLQTLIVLDRLSSNGTATTSAASVAKTFLLHLPNPPQFTSPNTLTEINGNQELRMTSLLTPAPQWQVVDEGAFTGTHASPSYYQYRLQENVSGSAQSYFLHVLQSSAVNAPAVTAQLTQDATSWTITLQDPGVGTAVIDLNKGMSSTGGAIGFSASAQPTSLTPLTNSVQSIQVTNAGPAWG